MGGIIGPSRDWDREKEYPEIIDAIEEFIRISRDCVRISGLLYSVTDLPKFPHIYKYFVVEAAAGRLRALLDANPGLWDSIEYQYHDDDNPENSFTEMNTVFDLNLHWINDIFTSIFRRWGGNCEPPDIPTDPYIDAGELEALEVALRGVRSNFKDIKEDNERIRQFHAEREATPLSDGNKRCKRRSDWATPGRARRRRPSVAQSKRP